MKFGNLIKAVVATSAFAAVLAAQASPLYFFGSAPTANGSFPQNCPAAVTNCAPIAAKGQFDADVAVTLSESFESSAAGFISLSSNSLPVLGGSTLTQSAPANGLLGGELVSGTSREGRFNTSSGAASGKWFESDTNFTINLGTAVGAFGFYGTDFNDFLGTLEIELLLGNTRVYANVFTDQNGDPLALRGTQTATQDGSLVFFGFASDLLFDRISFKVAQSPNTPFGDWDYLGFDDIMVGNLRTPGPNPNPAPEPGSLALVGLALFAAGWARKTQRRA